MQQSLVLLTLPTAAPHTMQRGPLSRREAAAVSRCSGMTVAGKEKVCQASPVARCQAIAKHCGPSCHTVQETWVIHGTETGLNHFL